MGYVLPIRQPGAADLDGQPSAVTGYDDSYAGPADNQNGNYQYLSDNSGLITLYNYYTTTTATATTPGGVAGYLRETELQQGQAGHADPAGKLPVLRPHRRRHHGLSRGDRHGLPQHRRHRGRDDQLQLHLVAGTVQMQSMTTTRRSSRRRRTARAWPTSDDAFSTPMAETIWDKDARRLHRLHGLRPGHRRRDQVDHRRQHGGHRRVQQPAGGLETPAGGGLNLVTTYQVDGLGRTIEETDPNGNITYTVYDDPDHEVRVYPGWNAGTGTPTGPTEVYRDDLAGSYTETLTMSADAAPDRRRARRHRADQRHPVADAST